PSLTLAALPDAALAAPPPRARRHRPRLLHGLPGRLVEELPPDEEADREDPDHERDPEVDPHVQEVVGRVDPQDLLERAEGRVPGDVEREERRPPTREAHV